MLARVGGRRVARHRGRLMLRAPLWAQGLGEKHGTVAIARHSEALSSPLTRPSKAPSRRRERPVPAR